VVAKDKPLSERYTREGPTTQIREIITKKTMYQFQKKNRLRKALVKTSKIETKLPAGQNSKDTHRI